VSGSGPAGYDIIGDVHGRADLLVRLLEAMGYRRVPGGRGFAHPYRRAVFVGDLVDRGPMIAEAVAIVRAMAEAGDGLVVLGNHEFNLLSFCSPGPDGLPLRAATASNRAQHRETLEQVRGRALDELLAWIRSLPLWLELDGLRVVHACWHPPSIDTLAAAARETALLGQPLLACLNRPGDPLADALERVVKGWELPLPGACDPAAGEARERRKIRVRWYADPAGATYRGYALQSRPVDCDESLDPAAVAEAVPYGDDEPPVFFGHYGLHGPGLGPPRPLAANVGCVDWGVSKGGPLVAYRWQGERRLEPDRFIGVT